MTERPLKARARNPRPTALAFEQVHNPKMDITRVSWTLQARSLLDKLRLSLRDRDRNASLPIRDLRLRLQVRDAGAIRVDSSLGQYGADRDLLATTTPDHDAAKSANAAVASWVQEAVLALKHIDTDSASILRRLALDGAAIDAQREFVEVFQWDSNRRVGTALSTTRTQYADLADFVACHLAGKTVYPHAPPLRRVVSSDLKYRKARLMTDPFVVVARDKEFQFSLGITVSVETYPGRPLPVVVVSHHKHVWARKPEKGPKSTTGYAFPRNENRAFTFAVERDLALGEEYTTIARQYNLSLLAPDARTLAEKGQSSQFDECPIYIAHLHGQGESSAAQRGIPDMDRCLSFEQMATILEPTGLRPWNVLREIPTHYGPQKDADGDWKHAFAEANEEGADDADASDSNDTVADKEAELQAWLEKMRQGIDDHYGGTYHFVIGYENGNLRDAELAKANLERLLGARSLIHLEAIPEDVHGPKSFLPGADMRVVERAQVRANAWRPFVETMREYLEKNPETPVHGLLIIAPQKYGDDHPKGKGYDDSMNKRVARIILNRELGLTVQYLLPARSKSDEEKTITADYLRAFRMRLVNAWRDMAWKSIGKMRRLDQKVQRSLQEDSNGESPPVLLGLGIIRTNRRLFQRNETCFIPYAIELDTSTGACQAALLLQRGDDAPRATPMMELRQLIKELTQNGPSRVARNAPANTRQNEQARHTQVFLHQVIAERAKLHRELIVFADMQTLSGLWPWLADSKLDPTNVVLANAAHAEQDFRNATIVRLRDDHAPKVLVDAPLVQVKLDGGVRPAANWSDANLYAIEDADGKMPTYISFGTRIFKARRGASCYRQIETTKGKILDPHTDQPWATPNGLEVTVIRTPPHRSPEGVAKLVEALRSEYEHYGSWTKYPAPLFFASFLKEYVPDYELDDEEDIDEEPDDDE